MRIFLAVDNSEYSERELARLVEERSLVGSAVCLCIAVNPFIPPDAVSICNGNASSRWAISLKAIRRVEELERALRFVNVSVETIVYETRWPENMALVIQAKRWKADRFIAGVHSFFGIRRRILETAFDVVKSKRREPPEENPDCGPGERSRLEYQRAA